MKKKIAILMTMVLLTISSSVVFANGFEDFTEAMNEDGSYTYTFDQGKVTVTMPEEWYQNTMVIGDTGSFTFYHKGSNEKYQEEGMEQGGKLFTLGACVDSSFMDIPETTYLGYDEEECMNYYITKPSDYQAYVQDDVIKEEYDALFSTIDDIAGQITIQNVKESGEHHVFMNTEEKGIIVDFPTSAKAGEIVKIETCAVADGEVVIELEGVEAGSFTSETIYEFTMPDQDVIVNARISTEGYAGS